ncbi:MAG TPA: DHA2 family efflux MFS transporter permease subunit [Alphaproteobacteria bacterium]|jgi:DHA2 family multidrug resistance protein|nr:DHA2 family efflux MFS transporter permease subunit [Alphaproteobacteria bacterium]
MTATTVDEAAPSGFQRAMVLLVLTSTVALYAMTVTIANVSLPQMQGALSATQDQIAWVVTFNIVATAVATPMTGWLTARFGQRRLLLFAVGGFAVASFLCGAAQSLQMLVLFRIMQGACGAPLAPLSQAIVLASYPQRQHGPVTAIFGMGVVIGPIIAPTLGGYLSEEYGWRWVFYMIVPFAVMSFLGCLAVVREGMKANRARLDWTGFLVVSLAVASFQLMLDRGERESWFESPEIIVEATLAAVAFYLAIVHTATHDRPFLNPRLFRDRNFAVGMLLVLIFGMLNFTPMTLLPPMMKALQGYPDSVIGELLALRGAGTLLGFFVMFFAGRIDPRFWLVLGFGLQGVAGWSMTGFDVTVPFHDVGLASFLQGLGVGFLWVPLTLVTFSTLSQDLLADGSAIFHLLRNLGSSIHISLSVALVLHTTKVNYGHLTEFITPFTKTLRLPWVVGRWDPDSVAGLARLGGEIQRQSLMIGYVNAFYLYAVTAFSVLPLIALVRYRRAR